MSINWSIRVGYNGRGGRNFIVKNNEKIKPKAGGGEKKKQRKQMKENATVMSPKGFVFLMGNCKCQTLLGGGWGGNYLHEAMSEFKVYLCCYDWNKIKLLIKLKIR